MRSLIKKDRFQSIEVVVRGTFRAAPQGQCFGQNCLSYEIEEHELLCAGPLSAQTSSPGGPQVDLEKLASLLKQGTVRKVKVLHLRDSTSTRVAVSKKALHAIANYTLDFSDQIAEKFGPLFSGVSAKKENHTPDLRWGLFFYDAQGQEIGSLFVDMFGQHGYVNDQTVSFETGTLARNLAKHLHKITRIRD